MSMEEPAAPLLSIPDILRMFKISRPTFWRLRRRGAFPQPILISPRLLRFDATEIARFIASRQAGATDER
jgi:predicted DNA-binding transcriptional regulator AlpA